MLLFKCLTFSAILIHLFAYFCLFWRLKHHGKMHVLLLDTANLKVLFL